MNYVVKRQANDTGMELAGKLRSSNLNHELPPRIRHARETVEAKPFFFDQP